MEYNKSLSARIRRRNAQGFAGVGTPNRTKTSPCGDYTNPLDSNKTTAILIEQGRKNKLGFKRIAKGFSIHKRALTKKFADNHQRMS